MWNFTYSFKMALIFFPILALVLTLPFFIYQYNKYGAAHWWRSVTLYTFVFYLLVCYLLVIMPLPSRSEVAQMTSATTQLKLFNFLSVFQNQGLRTGGLSAWITFIETREFQQVLFNIILTIPFGVYLRYYFKKSWFTTLILTGLLSLFFEMTQLSGLYGIYVRPYRLFDVDDLLLNTAGGAIGFILTPMIVFMFPTRDNMDQHSYQRSTYVGLIRRSFAVVIDLIMIGAISLVSVFLLFPNSNYLRAILHPRWLLKAFVEKPAIILITLSIAFIIFAMITFMTNGFTLGKRLVGIRLTHHKQQRISLRQTILRYGYPTLVLYCSYFALQYIALHRDFSMEQINGILLALFVVILLFLIQVIDLLVALFSKGNMTYERISHLENVAITDLND